MQQFSRSTGEFVGLERDGDEDNPENAERRKGRKARRPFGLKGLLAVLFDQVALRQMAGDHRQEDDENDLPEHRHEIDRHRRSHQPLHVKRCGQRTQNQAEHGHFYRCAEVAAGETGPRNSHAAGRQQGREQQPHGVERLIGEKVAAEGKGDEGNDREVDQLGQHLRLGIAALQHLGQFEADHHRVDHQKGQRNDQVFQPGGGCHQPECKAEQQGYRDGDDEIFRNQRQQLQHRVLQNIG